MSQVSHAVKKASLGIPPWLPPKYEYFIEVKVKSSLCLTMYHAKKNYGGVESSTIIGLDIRWR
jgi:hypothetical protein